MVTAFVQFKLPPSMSRREAIDLYKASAPRYQSVSGLIRKYYIHGDGGGGGIYLWKSREAAERLYNPEWCRMIRERYGAEPVITYFDTPVIVDNALGETITNA